MLKTSETLTPDSPGTQLLHYWQRLPELFLELAHRHWTLLLLALGRGLGYRSQVGRGDGACAFAPGDWRGL